MKSTILLVYAAFLLIMSIIAFILYYADKRKAVKNKWRIKESVLLGFGFFGGAAGALLAMKRFRHKTRHIYFWLINILGLMMHLAVLVYLGIGLK